MLPWWPAWDITGSKEALLTGWISMYIPEAIYDNKKIFFTISEKLFI